MKVDNHNPSNPIIEDDEMHNISKIQADPTVNNKDIASRAPTLVSFLSSLSY
jgi:hypothetical protein